MTHTPGRVEVHVAGIVPGWHNDAPHATILIASPACIACINANIPAGTANARRIAALWNMAEELGLSTEDIEAGCVKKLVEAARAMLDCPDTNTDDLDEITVEAVDQCRAALAPFTKG